MARLGDGEGRTQTLEPFDPGWLQPVSENSRPAPCTEQKPSTCLSVDRVEGEARFS